MKHLAQEALQAVARTGTCCCPCPTFHERVLSREKQHALLMANKTHNCRFRVCMCMCFFLLLCFMFTRTTTLDCAQAQEAPYLIGGEVLYKGGSVCCFRGYLSVSTICMLLLRIHRSQTNKSQSASLKRDFLR